GPRVDDHLPRVREVEDGTRDRPDENEPEGDPEGRRAAGPLRHPLRERLQPVAGPDDLSGFHDAFGNCNHLAASTRTIRPSTEVVTRRPGSERIVSSVIARHGCAPESSRRGLVPPRPFAKSS